MKFLTYKDGADLRVGALDDSHGVLDLVKAAKTLLGKDLPDSLRGIIEGGDDALNLARQTHKAALAKPDGLFTAVDKITFATPLPGVHVCHVRQLLFRAECLNFVMARCGFTPQSAGIVPVGLADHADLIANALARLDNCTVAVAVRR